VEVFTAAILTRAAFEWVFFDEYGGFVPGYYG
jgi:hypothetical protein